MRWTIEGKRYRRSGETLRIGRFDALILDLALPDIDGLEVFRSIPNEAALPVMMLTARGDPLDRILGLEMGADDYLPKPFEPRELLARLKSITRRGSPKPTWPNCRFRTIGGRPGSHGSTVGRRAVRLDQPSSSNCSQPWPQAAGRVMSRDYLMHRLRGNDLDAFDRSIDVHVSRHSRGPSKMIPNIPKG